MAFGDIGGAVTELVITCSTPKEGDVSIEKGDALCITGDYEVSNDRLLSLHRHLDVSVFGQALASADENSKAIPVKVRGVCHFRYGQPDPFVDGKKGVYLSAAPGQVYTSRSSRLSGRGVNVKVDEEKKEVHVLL